MIVDNDVDKNEYQTEKITKPQNKFGRNPFIDDSSDSENEEHNLEDKEEHFDAEVDEVPSGKFLGSRGVWREVFFFKVDDSRFKGANQYYIVVLLLNFFIKFIIFYFRC